MDWLDASVTRRATGYVPTSVGVHENAGALAGAESLAAHPGVGPRARTMYGAVPPVTVTVRTEEFPSTIEEGANVAAAVRESTTLTFDRAVPLAPSESLAQTVARNVPPREDRVIDVDAHPLRAVPELPRDRD